MAMHSREPEPDARRMDEHPDVRALLTAVIDSTSDLIWSVDPERFAIQCSNRALREYFRAGRGLEIRPGMTPAELLPTPEGADQWVGYYRRALRDGPYSVEYDTTMAGLALELHFTPLARDGAFFGVTVFGRDVTARRQADERLRRSEAFFRRLQESSPDLSAVIGPDGRYRFVSAASVHMLGYTPEELVAQRPLLHLHPDDRARMTRAIEKALARDGHVEHQRFRVRHRDGSWRHLDAVARSERSHPDMAGVVFNSRDVTEQVALARRLEHVREEEKARISRDLHDQLGQLLTGLQLDLFWLEERLEALPPTPVLGPLVERTVAASELAARTLSEVQRIATDLRPAALDRLGLGAALQEVARAFQARTAIRCRVEVAGGLPAVSPHAATALYRIAQEALTNVVRHAHATEVVIRLRPGAEGVVLDVEDDGVGIAPAAADEAETLGLAGMRERAALEGGDLAVRRGPKGGTQIEAVLP